MSDERRRFQPAEGMIDRAMVGSYEVVADLGCGNGYLAIPLAEKARMVVALDAQTEMLGALLERASGKQGDVLRPVASELPFIPLKDGSLDRVFLVNFLHELADKRAMISEISRVLRERGRVTFVDFQKKETVMGPPLHERIDEKDVPALFAGFELIQRFSFDEFYQFELSKR
ncbi:MAG: class I SAM-dependent methyltransferase [Euryarchaeota archaeon]|nr:class I SAM-dependent methyltransferase [Euryarchaeota archaeon]